MVASELEDRRRGLQDYLIALSQLETSWNSPTVTRVLCAEEDKVEKACGYADIGAHEVMLTIRKFCLPFPDHTLLYFL